MSRNKPASGLCSRDNEIAITFGLIDLTIRLQNKTAMLPVELSRAGVNVPALIAFATSSMVNPREASAAGSALIRIAPGRRKYSLAKHREEWRCAAPPPWRRTYIDRHP